MTEKKIKFALLGCGGIGAFHAEAINNIENAELIGVADNNFQSAKSFAEKRNITAYESYEELLKDENVDAVCICTPSGYHAENAIDALNAKKHVVLEKPMAIGSKDAMEIIDACEKNKCILTVISQLRFSKDIVRVRDLIRENAFGDIVFCDLYMKYWRDEEYYSSSPWKGTKKFDGGGALMNQGIHGVDLLLFMMGDAKIVSAKTKTAFHNIEVEDLAVALLEFENGALGTIEASTCACPGFERRIEIIGTEGCAILRENIIEKLVVKGETIIDGAQEEVLNTASNPLAGMSTELHTMQITNFINAICEKEELLIKPQDGVKAVKLIEEIYSK